MGFRRFIRGILLLFLVVSTMTIMETCEAKQKELISITISDEESILQERILSIAFQRLGYQVLIKHYPMKIAIAAVDDGDDDVLATQTAGTGQRYKNLIQVPTAISSIDMVVFASPEFKKPIQSWADLKGLKVAYSTQSVYVKNHLPPNVSKRVETLDYEKAFDCVSQGTADVAVVPMTEMRQHIPRTGVVKYSTMESLETYSYVTKEKEHLVPLLADEYKKMKQDGTLRKIKENKLYSSTGDKVVLHISSYNTDMIWERNIVEGVKSSLGDIDTLLYYNFELGLKRSANVSAQYKLMSEQIKLNFIERSPDVIIISDNDALNYLTKNYEVLFDGVPVVFCGINEFTPSMIYGREKRITGVTENISAFETVDQILKIYPETKNIYVINDHTITGTFWRESIEKDLEDFLGKVNIIYNEDIPIAEIIEKGKQLDNAVVLYGSFYRDCAGSYIPESKIIPLLDGINDKAIFSLTDENVGSGVLGGKVISGQKQGEMAGAMAAKLLSGKKISELPIVDDPNLSNNWLFDYKVAKKYAINVKNLPEGHKALNKEATIFETNPVLVIVSMAVFLAAVIIIIILMFSVRAQRIAKRKIEHVALHDELTGMKNRVAVSRHMEDLFSQGISGGVILFDLDGFKEINDVYGHAFGDFCLVEIANRLKSISSAYDMVARVGGDEFFIILLEGQERCKEVAGDIRKLLRPMIKVEGHAFHVTIGMGMAMFSSKVGVVTNIMQGAELALYKAKALGKDQFVMYDASLLEAASHQSNILQLLRTAVPDNEAFLLYQPIVDTSTEKVCSFEALIRIDNKSLGMLPPGEFIPLAESSELIVPLGLWVLETSCKFVKKLLEEGREFSYVSVNVSTIQLKKKKFVESAKEVIKKVGIDPKFLQFEITEGAFLDNLEENIEKLIAFRNMGIKVAIDDFGTGYSSMKNLVNLPIDTLKIDKSFVDDVESDNKKRIIAKLIINTAHSLSMKVVAEGVEKVEQKDFLKSIGCDMIQGYHYSRPLTGDMLGDFLQKQNG